MRVLATGATGFIGTNLVQVLAERHQVISLGRRRAEAAVEHLEVDFGKALEDLVIPPGTDAVIHLAQSAHYGEFPGGALDVFRVNVESTMRLLDASVRAGVRWLFLASTGSVYEPYDRTLEESACVSPQSFYSVSKRAAEQIALSYSNELQICIFRLFFPYGPGQSARLVPRLVERIRSGEPVVLSKDGDGFALSLIHVSDVAHLISFAMERRWTGVINVASDEATTLRGLATAIGAKLQTEPRFVSDARMSCSLVPDLSLLRSLAPEWKAIPLEQGLEFVAERRGQLGLGGNAAT